MRGLMLDTRTKVMENILKRDQLCEAENYRHLCYTAFNI